MSRRALERLRELSTPAKVGALCAAHGLDDNPSVDAIYPIIADYIPMFERSPKAAALVMCTKLGISIFKVATVLEIVKEFISVEPPVAKHPTPAHRATPRWNDGCDAHSDTDADSDTSTTDGAAH